MALGITVVIVFDLAKVAVGDSVNKTGLEVSEGIAVGGSDISGFKVGREAAELQATELATKKMVIKYLG